MKRTAAPRPVSPHGMTEDNVFALHEVGRACLYPRGGAGWLRAGFVAAWIYVLAFQVLFAAGHAPAWAVQTRSVALVALPLLALAALPVSRRLALAFVAALALGAALSVALGAG